MSYDKQKLTHRQIVARQRQLPWGSAAVVRHGETSSGYAGIAFSAEQAEIFFQVPNAFPAVVCVLPPESKVVSNLKDAIDFFDGVRYR